MNAVLQGAVPEGLGALERLIKDDFNGDCARALIARLDLAAGQHAALIDHAGPVADGTSRCVPEGFEAAQRIVRSVWQRLHGSVLTA